MRAGLFGLWMQAFRTVLQVAAEAAPGADCCQVSSVPSQLSGKATRSSS
jgi:hypothetical protein